MIATNKLDCIWIINLKLFKCNVFTFRAYIKMMISIENEPLSTKSPRNKYLVTIITFLIDFVVSGFPPTSKILIKS